MKLTPLNKTQNRQKNGMLTKNLNSLKVKEMNKKIKDLIESYEKEAIHSFKTAMKFKGIDKHVCISEAGLCAERLCYATYTRVYSKKYSGFRKYAYNLVVSLNKEGVISSPLKVQLDSLRKFGNLRKHEIDIFSKSQLENIRLTLIDIVRWYENHFKVHLGLDLGKRKKNIHRGSLRTMEKLRDKGIITGKAFELTKNNEVINTLQIEDKSGFSIPIFASLLIDVSGSMIPFREEVIASHKECLSALRGCIHCDRKSFYLMQHLFSTKSQLMNPLTLLDNKGDDKIVSLDSDNYSPHGRTALFDSLHEALSILSIELDSFKTRKGKKPEIIIGVVTDGVNNESQHSAQDVKNLLQHLEKEEVIRASVLIGWTDNKDFDESQLIKLKDEMGFRTYAAINKLEPKAIRRAFNTFSNYAIG